MAEICQKCGYERNSANTAPSYECPKCGAVYAKVAAQIERERFEEQRSEELAKQRKMSSAELKAERVRLFGKTGKSKVMPSGGLSAVSNRSWLIIGFVVLNGLIWTLGDFSSWHPFGMNHRKETHSSPLSQEGASASDSRYLPFDVCVRQSQATIKALNVPQSAIIPIVNTATVVMTRVCTADGSVLITCSKPDSKMVFTRSPHGANVGCK